MFNSVSVSGMLKNDCFKVEATLMYPDELPTLIAGYNAYSITVTSKKERQPVKATDFCFCLLCKDELIQPVKLSVEEKKLIEIYCKEADNKETILVLFPSSFEIHYMKTQFLFCNCHMGTFGIFTLKY